MDMDDIKQAGDIVSTLTVRPS